MTKYILSQRSFREEFSEKIKEIAPDYQLITAAPTNWADVAITIGWHPSWAEHLLTGSSHLKWVQSISAGVDYLPLKEYQEHRVLLSNASGIHARSIADHVLTAIFMRLRGFDQTTRLQQKHTWNTRNIHYSYLHEQRILIVGTGHIGQQLAKNLTVLGNTPAGINTTGHPVDGFAETYADDFLIEEASRADFIINILPLTEATHHLYDSKFFNKLKNNATFINVGRGPSVDTDAIVAWLEENPDAYAALDVFEEEPLPEGSPLWSLKNVLITPHISGQTPHFQTVFMEIFLANLESFVNSEQLVRNQVELDRGY